MPRTAQCWIRFLALGIALFPGLASALELAPGDIVLFSDCGIYRLDPETLDPTKISDCLGFGSEAHHLIVDRRGRLLITDEARGIVVVSSDNGERTAFMPVETLGGPPRGIGLGTDGSLLVSVQSATPRLVRIDADTRALSIVTEGGMLIAPTGVAVAPDGAILVADQGTPTTAPIPNLLSLGALVRVDAATGEQTRVAADPLYQAPQEVACSGDLVWLVNLGLGLRTGKAGLTVTRLSDGTTTQAPVGYFASRGVAVMSDGRIAYSACVAAHGDCTSQYVSVYGSGAWLGGYIGPLAVVPERESPKATLLAPSVPNPFGASTVLSFTLSTTGKVELSIFSVDGRRVVTLERRTFAAGSHKVTWDGRDAAGGLVRSGIYFARLRSAEGEFARTVVLIR